MDQDRDDSTYPAAAYYCTMKKKNEMDHVSSDDLHTPAQMWRSTARALARYVRPLYFWTVAFGFDPLVFVTGLKGFLPALRNYLILRRQMRAAGKKQKLRFSVPCLADKQSPAAILPRHYFYQDLLVAQRIFRRSPVRHVDVGSRVDGFVAHVAGFRVIEVFDIRPLNVAIPTIIFRQTDLMKPRDEFKDYCDSLSCLHALEHFGLGRYGDPVDLDGHKRGFQNLSDILQVGGILYLSVPIGPERIDFNANRVFGIGTILGLAKDHFELESFSLVDDDGILHKNVGLTPEAIGSSCGCYYGCGIFELRKRR